MAKDKLKSRFFAASSSADQSNQRVKRKKSEGGQLIGSRGHYFSGASRTPLHKPQASLFSSASGWTNFRGLFNLAILLLFVSNGRVALENLIKYGILIDPSNWLHYTANAYQKNWQNLCLALCSQVTVLLSFFAEKFLAKRVMGDIAGLIFYIVLLTLHIIAPAWFILWMQGNPLFASMVLTTYVVIFLKMVSYAHVNYWYRESARVQARDVAYGRKIAGYPENINLKNLYYFILAPTLCYEVGFPKNAKIRKGFLFKRFLELVSLSFIIVALYQQWVIPLLRNSVEPFSTMKIGHCLERVLKLAIPNHVIWLICFYTFFHSFLNFMAELLCFADRQFYLDFWNAETLSVFWKTWNIPVHRWAVRHVYKPMVSFGFSKMSASVAVFFISAFFHEYLVSIPLSMFRLWAFYGMISQIPLSFVTDKILQGGRAGNIMMWVTLILGQPMAILIYVHDWYFMHYPHGAPADALLS
ncbi:unnamed protein product [Enterobius vermicularis]|uniref:O-acyltransferase n=1 Tax=Enterobius vermicularis TaxID=51028 RepID=A0A0N4VD38_ENTVE|nr:unnamed protein product [Enterobius vermicularis]